jgi:hypothetical protein
MNIINAGNPSANNMIIRQVMQKKRQSSATIFDKLNKRTAKLTAKNPLNNVLTNDQLFRYYIKEVEPRLSQSNDNFSGLPNMTPPDNSIRDTTDKDFGDAGTGGGGGGFGPLNSNDISQMTPIPPSAPYDPTARAPPQRPPPPRPTRTLNQNFSRLTWEEQDAQIIDWYNNDRPQLLQLITEFIVDGGDDATPENIQFMLSNIERKLGLVPERIRQEIEPQRIRQEIEPQRIRQEIEPKSTPPNIPFGVLRKEDAPRTEYVPPPDPERELHQLTSQEWIRNYQLQQQLAELGFDDNDDNEIWNTYGRPVGDWPEAGLDEEFAEMLRLPSFDMSNPNYDPRANDAERQFQIVGTPRNVGPPDNRRSDFLMAMANYESPNSPAASRVVPFVSPISSSIVPRTALLGRAPWGTQTRSMAMRGGTALNFTGPEQEEDSSLNELLAGAPVPKEFKTPSKKKK